MKNYIMKTTATMKPHNNKKWWIDPGIVREIRVSAENARDALNQYREILEEKYYISISDNAIKTKSEMYVDTKSGEPQQIGYVITGKTDFEDRDNYRWSAQYIDLWVEIITTTETDFAA